MEKIHMLYENFNWMTAVLVAISYIIVDGLYAKYTLEVVKLRPVLSATLWSGMHFLLAFGVVNYTENRLYIFPLAIWSRIGTYLVVEFEQKKR
jgi:tryptophan-rich sensory protein